MFKNNFILETDSYKLSHYLQYPKGTEFVRSYFESRGGLFPSTLFVGLQYYLMAYLQGVQVTELDIYFAEKFAQDHFGKKDKEAIFNKAGWEYIVKEYGGKLPLRIKAIAEGTLVPVSNVLFTIENTDKHVPFLTNYAETLLSKVWYPTTVATNGFFCKQKIKQNLNATGNDSPEFKLHDFGYRGVSSEETAGIGGMAHLVNFYGTDTLAGILYAQEYYNSIDMLGFSVPASEHSTMTTWGKEGELDAILNMLDSYPTGIVSVVGDSWNIREFCIKIGQSPIKEKIMKREGTFVVRPDSGDTVSTLAYIFNQLWADFGGSYNDKGFRLLDPHIRVIQGDSIDLAMIGEIYAMMKATKFSGDNITFGSGGGLLQKFDRDTQKFAIKCSSAVVNGEERDVYKEAPGKQSKKGRLKLTPSGNYSFLTVASSSSTPEIFNGYVDAMETVFENGEIKKEFTLQEVRDNANKWLEKVDKQIKK